MSTAYGNNTGLRKAMALDTLGNAYLYLRNAYSTTTWNTPEGLALLETARIIRGAFVEVRDDFTIFDFTEQIHS